MPRIRAVKPETWVSETLAEVSVTAMLTFIATTNHADDFGRHRDNAAILAGLIWPLRAAHTAVHVEDDLQQLENAGAICRYTGCDGRRYLHYPTWFNHQKIDKPSASRLPACPHHTPERCGACKGPCTRRTDSSPTATGGFGEASPNAPRALDLPARPASTPPADQGQAPAPQQDALVDLGAPGIRSGDKVAGQAGFSEASPKAPRNLGEGSAPGSRILDPGSSFPTGRTAPNGDVSANRLLGEYIAACDQRPPGDVIGHLGRITKKLLAEHIAPEHIRTGLLNFAANPMHPSVLTSMVNEAMNPRAAGLARPGFGPKKPLSYRT